MKVVPESMMAPPPPPPDTGAKARAGSATLFPPTAMPVSDR